MCGTLMGSFKQVKAMGLAAGAAAAGETISFLEALFMAGGIIVGVDALTNKSFNEDDWDFGGTGSLLDDPATQGQIDSTEKKVNEYYDNAVKEWYKNHGGSSKPTPTPMITEPPAPNVTPPVTVAPINPDDVTMPDDWATMKKNATDKGVLAMGAATAYCVKEAIKGWWDELMDNTPPAKYSNKENPYKNDKYIGYLLYECDGIYQKNHLHVYRKAYVYDTLVDSDLSYISASKIGSDWKAYHVFSSKKKSGSSYYGVSSYVVEKVDYPDYSILNSFTGSNIYNYPSSYDDGTTGSLNESYVFSVPVVIDGQTIPASVLPLDKSSVWPSTDLKDDYDNNKSLPTPSYPNLAVPSITLPTLDEIKDLWKQGSDDEENRPTYVTNFITNHTVQPTPDPEPTEAPDAKPTPTIAVAPVPGGKDNPETSPAPSTTPAVNPDPGGSGGSGTDPDNPNPSDPTPEEEASPYKADLREVFPFCIPFDLIHLLKVFEADAEAPVFEFPLDIELDNPWTGEKVVDYHHTFKLDMSDYEPVIKILRIFQVVFFIIALMLITRQQMIKG